MIQKLCILGVVLFALPAFSKTEVSFVEEDMSFHVVFKDQVALEGEKPKAAEKLYTALPAPKQNLEDPNLLPQKIWRSTDDHHREISCSAQVFRCPACTYFTCGVVINAERGYEDMVMMDGELETVFNAQDSERLYNALRLIPKEHPMLGKGVLSKQINTEDDRFHINCYQSESVLKENGGHYFCRMLIKLKE